MSQRIPGTVLAQRHKGAVTWQARISQDRGRLEVVGIIQPSETSTIFALLEQHELLELLGEGADLDDLTPDRPAYPHGRHLAGRRA